jgi:cob(I)alamin adenosyltransferase
MLDTQKRAAAEMTELEDRLEKLHAPLQDRLRAYQARISELEKELATKGEENRELTKAKIQLVRKQLAATQDQLGLN